jgi:Flp pilus assembly protein TadG
MHPRIRKVRLLRRLHRLSQIRSLAIDERGVQLAELAIVLPILLILFAATAEFGRYFYEYTTLSKAARIGTRYLVIAKIDDFERGRAKNLVVFGNVNGTGDPLIENLEVDHVIITARNELGQEQTEGVPQTVTVEIVGFTHKPLFDLGGMMKKEGWSLAIDVKPSVTMRYLLTTPLV